MVQWLIACKSESGTMYLCRLPQAYSSDTPGLPSEWYPIGPGTDSKVQVYSGNIVAVTCEYASQLRVSLVNTAVWPPTVSDGSDYIPVDAVTSITQGYATISGYDLVFYIDSANDLCVQQLSNSSPPIASQTLVSGANWLTVVTLGSTVHVYYTNLVGQLYHFPFTTANFSVSVSPTALSTVGVAISMSACYAPNATPPVYALMVDNGTNLTIYTSSVANFSSITGKTVTYTNNDPTTYVGLPAIAIHPQDTNWLTVSIQSTTVSSGAQQIGFYVVPLPGVS